MNSQQGKLIAFIHEHQEQGLIQKDLSERFHVRGASITSMLQGLEKKGYIERKIPAHNERQKNIYVLPKGLALFNDFQTILPTGRREDRSESQRRRSASSSTTFDEDQSKSVVNVEIIPRQMQLEYKFRWEMTRPKASAFFPLCACVFHVRPTTLDSI
ncbi:MarR family winged helix-turn-helix transcriptional regulator [Paenibacillus chitinolyticus]|uniref:MarR family winged helix-turn-helix transcriptional regulator n=1 Tax=Paenibacillus chitinolyticus TaxID=79263 RepID=UPI003558042D